MMEILVTASLATLIYIYMGYPILVWLMARCFGMDPKKAPHTPHISLFIPAYNEEKHIEMKIKNSLGLDYPKDKLHIVIASDGSTDQTNQIAKQYADEGVQLVEMPKNIGKAAMLTQVVPQLEGEVIVFSDTSSELEPNALLELMQNFADPWVGCVSGLYRLRKATRVDSRSQSEGFYWRYETFMKYQESRLHSILGAHGAFYAMRKKLFTELDKKSINDDYILAMRVVRQGYRSVYEPRAVAWERELSSVDGEFARRQRIAAGNVQQLFELWTLFNPMRGWVAFCFFSHKGLRTFSPVFLLTFLIGSMGLEDPIRLWALGVQGVFYAMAVVGYFQQRKGRASRVFSIPAYFCLANLAMFAGLLTFCFGGGRAPKWGDKS